MPVFVREEQDGLVFWRFLKAPVGVHVVFTTRYGGVSAPPYDMLNLGYHVGDRPELVTKNRGIISRAIGIDPRRLTSPRQLHTAAVAILETAAIGSGAPQEHPVFDPCDGLATSVPDAPILLHFADCAPVVLSALAPGGTPVVSVLHAGRQGLAAGVVARGVQLMEADFDIQPQSLVAAVGPAIGACCYEVGEEIAAAAESRFGPGVVERRAGGAWLAMQSAVRAALLQEGLAPEKIHVLAVCTSCNQDFYSYRRDGVTGRHGAIAWIG